METKIRENIDQPEVLEKLYRSDKKGFEKSFWSMLPTLAGNPVADFWKARLAASKKESVVDWKADLLFLILACFATGLLIQIPKLFHLNLPDDTFYMRNAVLIVFFGLSAYSLLTGKQAQTVQWIVVVAVFFLSALYINVLPLEAKSQTVLLACIHLPLLLWGIYGWIFIGFDWKRRSRRMVYIRHNGDLAILSAILLLAGGLLTAVTLGMFSAIDLDIEHFYSEYIIITGLVCVPLLATHIVRIFPSVTQKIAPIIAAIFGPLVLLTLLVFLITMLVTGKDPYNNREFLVVFNLMLVGVMAIIVFSVSEPLFHKNQRNQGWILFLLTFLALVVDLIALSAIIYRVGEYGFTPNRTAVLGSNLLIFGNLLLILIDLFRVVFRKGSTEKVESTLAAYLPVYLVWTFLVAFGWPLLFGFA